MSDPLIEITPNWDAKETVFLNRDKMEADLDAELEAEMTPYLDQICQLEREVISYDVDHTDYAWRKQQAPKAGTLAGDPFDAFRPVYKARAMGPSAESIPYLEQIGAKEIQLKVNQLEREALERMAEKAKRDPRGESGLGASE